MSSLADKLLSRVGKTRADINPQSSTGKMFRRHGVTRTPEFLRILSLPRRDWEKNQEEAIQLLNAEYGRSPSQCHVSCECRGKGSMDLKPVQAAALVEIYDLPGLFGAIGVGRGKTLISFLAPKICEAKRPLLLIPARHMAKTEAAWYRYAVHWKIAKPRIESYEKFGVANNADLFEQIAPDFIFADEGHRLKNTKAAVTRRLGRYLKANRGTKVVIASGTVATKSLREYWHLLKWTIGEELMPLPVHWQEMMEWGEALDVKQERAVRMAPGCLVELVPGYSSRLTDVREGYQKRLRETPGVIVTPDKGYRGSLAVTTTDLPLDHLAEHYQKLRNDQETPDGWSFTDPVELWRHAREIACGFYYVWDPRPPEEWMLKRKRWHKYVREVLKHSHKYDTELQVAQAVHRGLLNATIEVVDPDTLHIEHTDVYKDWREIEPTFKPNTVPVWIDDTALKYAAAWLEDNEKGIVWVEHPCFGEMLSDMTGRHYFGRQALDTNGRHIEKATGPVIASVATCGDGVNLQFNWHKNLVTSCQPNARVVEQLLGRTHRDGQTEDEVTYEFIAACKEHILGLNKTISEANYVEQTTGQPQKILFADRTVPSVDDLAAMSGPRWC